MKNTLELLKENKIKITGERRVILSVLEKATLPLTQADIYQKLCAVLPKANLTTVYRNVEMLESLGLIKRLSHDKAQFSYELTHDRPHHHHLVCQHCGRVEDLEAFSEKFVEEVGKLTDYRIEDHNLEFFGLCPDCQEAK